MRLLAVCSFSLVLAACNATYSNPTPAGRFYFPTGLAHVDVPGSSNGALFVANSNWDRRYSAGSVTAVNLDEVALPAFGAAVSGGPKEVTDLGGAPTAQITMFSGELAVLERGNGQFRVFVPSRSEGMKFQAVDAVFNGGATLSCFPAGPSDNPTDCGTNAPSLSPANLESTTEGVPRAAQPYGVSVRARVCTTADDCGSGRACSSGGVCLDAQGGSMADLYVTHLAQVDSPLGSLANYRGYLVHLESDQMTVDATNFVNIGNGASSSAVTGQRWTYVTGRYLAPNANLLRLVDRAGNVLTTGLEGAFRVLDSRGVALGSNEARLYVIGRNPDVLLVMGIASPDTASPSVGVIHSIPLPVSPEELVVIPRAGRGDLVAITCSGAPTGQLTGALAIYDEDVGQLVAQVSALGLQPFGVTVDRRGNGARFFVSDFGDGRVAVVDVPELDRAQDARLVAHLGESQLCLTQASQTAGCVVTQ